VGVVGIGLLHRSRERKHSLVVVLLGRNLGARKQTRYLFFSLFNNIENNKRISIDKQITQSLRN
jgi:hypothetical protein